jgi:hypothetical protein
MNNGKRHSSMWIRVGKLDIKTDNLVMVEQVIRPTPDGKSSFNAVRLWRSFRIGADGTEDTYDLDCETSALFLTMLHSEQFSQWDFVLTQKTPDIDAAYGPPG